MTKGRYVIVVEDVVLFLVVDDGQLHSCRAYQPTDASWRRLSILLNKSLAISSSFHAAWVMPRKG